MTKATSWDEQKQKWTNQFVTADASQPQLRRFANQTGRVVAINGSQLCIVDFQDGGWYDIAPEFLRLCTDQEEAARRYNPIKNSAQAIPHRQG